MNDLAEKALHGLDVARRKVVSRPMLSFGIAGFLLSATAVVAGGLVSAVSPTRPLTGWLGLLDSHGLHQDDWVPGAVLFGAIAGLVVLWVCATEFIHRHRPAERRLWSVAAGWALPFIVGPPLMGTSVYTYAAFGLLQRHGHNPYDVGPNRLGSNEIVAAIDPGARGTPSAAGPLGTLVEHVAVSVSAGSTLGAVLVLRALGVVAAIVIGRLAADLAGSLRTSALALTVLNPLVLLYIVSGARLDGLMLVFGLAAILAAHQRRWLAAVALACLAGSVSGQGFLLLPVIVAVHWLGRRRVPGWLLIGRDLGVAAVTTAVAGLVVHDGFGWLWTVHNQFSAHTPFSFAAAIAKLLTPIVRGASYDDLAAGGRITVLTAMVCIVVYLVITARQRALERTAGYALLALGLLAPVLYPWYLLWGALCLAPTATGTRRVAVIALCAAGCLLAPPGFSPTTTNVITAIALVVTGALATTAVQLQQPDDARAAPVSAER